MMSPQLVWPHLFAAGAALLAVLVILSGLRQRSRWSRAVRELRQVSRDLETVYGLRDHRELHSSFEEVFQTLLGFSKNRPGAHRVLEELRPAIAQYHRQPVAGSNGANGAWSEIQSSFLERKRQPVRLTRAAAGWVVLLGLAGTVLGFMEALPALRDVLAPPAPEAAIATPSRQDKVESAEEQAAAQVARAGQKLNRVLDSLRGVFLATLWGVISAFLLSACTLLLLEPAFDRFADQVDLLGARWFEPLLQSPDNLMDDALRAELRSYFEEISRRLDIVLQPLIGQLRLSLEQMSGLATDFSDNIRMGVDTLGTFHQAVSSLGGSAQSAVDQLVQIVKTSSAFVSEVETMQQKGMANLAQTLSGPTNLLAGSASAMRDSVEGLAGHVASLARSSQAIETALKTEGQEKAVLRRDLAQQSEILRTQLQTSFDTTAERLRVELAGSGDKRALEEVRRSLDRIGHQLVQLDQRIILDRRPSIRESLRPAPAAAIERSPAPALPAPQRGVAAQKPILERTITWILSRWGYLRKLRVGSPKRPNP